MRFVDAVGFGHISAVVGRSLDLGFRSGHVPARQRQ